MRSKTLFAPTPGPDRSAAYSEGFKQAASQNTGKTQGDAYLKHRSWQGALRLVVGLEKSTKATLIRRRISFASAEADITAIYSAIGYHHKSLATPRFYQLSSWKVNCESGS